MTRSYCKKHIQLGITKLNQLQSSIIFSMKEDECGVYIQANSRFKKGQRFGVYECMEFFEDNRTKVEAYLHCANFVQALVAGANLLNPKAYHNMV